MRSRRHIEQRIDDPVADYRGGMQAVRVTPPGSLVLVHDAEDYERPPPDHADGSAVPTAGRACVAVGTCVPLDGPTDLAVARAAEEPPLPPLELHDAPMEVTSGALAVSSSNEEPYITLSVEPGSTRVRVYANHATEPDRIVVVAG